MITDFAFSVEGFTLLRKYKDRFGCDIRIDEPSGESLILDVGDRSYRIDNGMNIDDFKKTITESLEAGKNLLLEKLRDNEIKYRDDALY